MQPGSVIVDVAIDQGGCVETIHATTHENPTYVVDGVIHYGVANMPGGVPRTSTLALTNATFPYALQLANKGWKKALADNPALLKGLNVVDGKMTYRGVAEAFGDGVPRARAVPEVTRRTDCEAPNGAPTVTVGAPCWFTAVACRCRLSRLSDCPTVRASSALSQFSPNALHVIFPGGSIRTLCRAEEPAHSLQRERAP